MPVTIAALYVERGGPYFGMPDVDPWDVERDATGTHRAEIELTGHELDSAIVRCTFLDLERKAFRAWLAFDLATRFPEPTTKIQLEVGP